MEQITTEDTVAVPMNTPSPVEKSLEIKKKKTPVKDAVVFSLILAIVLVWVYTLYLWMLCCFDWSTAVYKFALSSIVTASIITVVAIVIIIVLGKLTK